MPDFDAFQVFGQGLTTGADARGADLGGRGFQLDFDGGQVLIGIVVEQVALFGGEGFVPDAETQALVVGEFEGEFVIPEDFKIAAGG